MKAHSDGTDDAAKRIRDCIESFAASAENNLGLEGHEPAWGRPLVGFARGDDPLWTQLKQDIGTFYLTPREVFTNEHASSQVSDEELTVISWILPQTKQTKIDTRKEKTYPSERWARARKYGEEFNVKLRDHLLATLAQAGHEVAAPRILPPSEWKISERHGLSSTWSERHAAYVAGLGTFGLCDGLITPVGKAIRCGSVIARISIPPSVRPYDSPFSYCLFLSKGTCGKCITRCPAGAITKSGHDKSKCREYAHRVILPYVKSHFGFESYGCGMCQTGVPCESRIPVRAHAEKLA